MLEEILAPIEPQIDRFEKRLAEVLKSDVSVVMDMTRHLQRNRGKRFRPALALLTAQAIGECTDKVIDAAVGIEIIQTATLIHDDVIDDAETRRGAEGLHVRWNNRLAILMGDFLLARALQILVGLGSMDVMAAATRSTQSMIEGEILEAQSDGEAEEALYFSMIGKKTASLMALACEVGAILGSGTPDQIAKMATFGNEFGVAFQITDDLLDFVGDEDTLGKPVGGDVRERKLTLPLIRAIGNCRNGDGNRIHVKVRNGVETEEDWQEIIHFVQRYNGIESARNEARAYANSALQYLGVLQGSAARDALSQAVLHVVERDR